MSDKLFNDFPPISREEWENKIIEDLKGADYDKKLVWNTENEFSVRPYYREDDLVNTASESLPDTFPFARGYSKKGNNWQITQKIRFNNSPEKANQFATEAVKKGAQGLSFTVKNNNSEGYIKTLLKDIDLSQISVHFNSAEYTNLVDSLKKIKTNIRGSFDFDSFGYYLRHGNFYNNSNDNNIDELVNLLKSTKTSLPNMHVINVNGQNFSNAGSTASEEIAYTLSAGIEYINQLTEKGVDIEDILPKMKLTLSIGPSYFMEIAKFRVIRILWANLMSQYTKDTKLQKIKIHGISSLYNKTVYDLYNNMLRNTTEAMSAAIGGADEITILPHDYLLEEETTFGDRIARNVQLMIREESYFGRVADPAAGSYYIETLTKKLAEKAWELFLDIENKGGFIKAMTEGYIKKAIEDSVAKRNKQIASRKRVYVGINNYPNIKEKYPETAIFPHSKDTSGNALKMIRGSENFEELRYRTDLFVKEGNQRPKALMLQFGHLAMRNARAMFSNNLIGISGYCIESATCDNIDEAKQAIKEVNPSIIVLCSSDEEYLTIGIDFITAAKEVAPQATLIVAGNPGENEATLRKAGIEEFIHVRSAVLEILQKLHQKLSIK